MEIDVDICFRVPEGQPRLARFAQTLARQKPNEEWLLPEGGEESPDFVSLLDDWTGCFYQVTDYECVDGLHKASYMLGSEAEIFVAAYLKVLESAGAADVHARFSSVDLEDYEFEMRIVNGKAAKRRPGWSF